MNTISVAHTIKDTILAAYATWAHRPYIWTLRNDTYESVTYGEIIGRACAVANGLVDEGFRDAHIAIFARNSAEWAIADYAISLSANIAVLMDATWQLLEAKNAAMLVKPAILYYDSSTKDVAYTLKEHLPDTQFRSLDNLPGSLDSIPDTLPDRNPNDLAKIFFSSGTTGTPKAIMLSETNMLFGWKGIEQRMDGVNEDDVCYTFLPFHHVFANVIILLYALPIGCQVYLCSDIKQAQHEMALARPTIIHGVPLFYERIYSLIPPRVLAKARRAAAVARVLHLPLGVRKKIFSALHEALGGRVTFLICGGANLDPAIHQFFDDAGLFIYNAYGSTETAGALCAMAPRSTKHASAGRPYDHMEVAILSPDDEGAGEIIARGPGVFLGYYDNPTANEAALDEAGYYHTGDIGRFDDDGDLYITGRKKRMILLSNGENIWPEEIEKLFIASSHIVSAQVYEKNGSINATIAIQSDQSKSDAKADCQMINKSLSRHRRVDHFRYIVFDESKQIKLP